MRTLGRVLFAVGLFGLGVFTFLNEDFSLVWQTAPKDFPFPALLARVLGAGLIALAIAALLDRFLAALPIFIAVVFLAPQLFARTDPWLERAPGMAEIVAAFSGAWVLARLPRPKIAQIIYGLCCVEFGVSHFQYAKYTATIVPGFLPGHLFFAYLTGAGHALAGLSILTGVLAAYGAIAEAAMLSSFVLLIHLPSLFFPVTWTKNTRFVWIEFLWATTVTAAAWCMAAFVKRRNTSA
jgi:uncharacterized membrane protein